MDTPTTVVIGPRSRAEFAMVIRPDRATVFTVDGVTTDPETYAAALATARYYAETKE